MFCDLRSRDSDRSLRACRSAAALGQRPECPAVRHRLNCTLSIASAMLLKLVHAPRTVGAHLSDDWRFVLWTLDQLLLHQRVSARIQRHQHQRCLPQSHEDAPPVPAHSPSRTRTAAKRGTSSPDTASASRTSWSACNSAQRRLEALARHPFRGIGAAPAAEKSAKICLLGVESEAPARPLSAQAPGLAVHLFGQTAIPQLAASRIARARHQRYGHYARCRGRALSDSPCRSDTFIFVRPVPTAKAIWRSNAGKTTSPP